MELRRFAFSTSCFGRLPLSRALSQIAAAGFSSVELRADVPHLWLDRVSPTDISALRKQLGKLKLGVAAIDAGHARGFWGDPSPEPIFEPSLISRDRRLREWRIAYTKKALRLGRELGAQSVMLTSGRPLTGMQPEEAQKLLEEGVLRLLEYADSLGQRLALACEPGLFLEHTAELKALLKRIDSPHLGACLDVAVAAARKEDPRKAIAALKDYLLNVRLADIRGAKHFRHIPGKGDVDFAGLFRALKTARYTGPLVWDIDTGLDAPADACAAVLKFLKKSGTKNEKRGKI